MNVNAIIAETTSELIKASFNSIMDKGSKKFKDLWALIFEDFSPYMEDIYRRNSNVRIICQKEKDVSFKEIYIQSFFSSGAEKFSDDDIIQEISTIKILLLMEMVEQVKHSS